jgi:hypothetical protein
VREIRGCLKLSFGSGALVVALVAPASRPASAPLCARHSSAAARSGVGTPGPGPRLVWGSLLGGAAGVALSPVGGVIGWNIGVERWMP